MKLSKRSIAVKRSLPLLYLCDSQVSTNTWWATKKYLSKQGRRESAVIGGFRILNSLSETERDERESCVQGFGIGRSVAFA